ncbi:MAG: DUF2189 domain-containing protein [Comamonadaceae bacterium]|nr:DUF2189 domain-containing protein [Comamonadaceae bacterium]
MLATARSTASPTASLFAAIGWLILILRRRQALPVHRRPSPGFFLLAPARSLSGLYEISRRRGQERAEPDRRFRSRGYSPQRPVAVPHGRAAWRSSPIGWERISAILFALLYGGAITGPVAVRAGRLPVRRLPALRRRLARARRCAGRCRVRHHRRSRIPMMVDRDVDTGHRDDDQPARRRRQPGPMLLWAATDRRPDAGRLRHAAVRPGRDHARCSATPPGTPTATL